MMAECSVSEVNKNINSSSKQSSDGPSCQDFKTEEVMEPLLLEDFRSSRIPISLSNVLKQTPSANPNKIEFLVGCVYVLMLEYGFIPRKKEICFIDSGFNYTRIKELSYRLIQSNPQSFDEVNNSLYSSSFILPPDELHVCRLSCIKMGDELIINASVRNIEDTYYTLLLDILSYFTDGLNQCGDFRRVQNMRALSTLFKDKVAFPIKHSILSILGQRNPSLENLPIELIHHIFKYIHGINIVRLTTTCKRFFTIRQDAKLWSYLLKRDFSISMKKNDYKELLENYGRVCKQLKLGDKV